MGKRVAVLLCGCGVKDGSEIHEAVLTLLALDLNGAAYQCCAPDGDQVDVVNHLTGQAVPEKRNMLVEAARIARGSIVSLSTIKARDFDAIVIPGGFGSAKNLHTYASDGRNAKVHPEVASVVREFHAAGKPIGAICISPVLIARIFRDVPDAKPSLTIGTDEGTAADIRAFGAEHVSCPVRDFVVDKKNRIVSTPAYMLGKGPADIYHGIEKLVKALLELCGGN